MDIFDKWVAKLPRERKFSKSKVPPEKEPAYNKWKELYGLEETDDYDLAGAFLSGQAPIKGHLGSFGNEGKLLKSPTHETAWKTAFTEMYGDLVGVYPVIDDDMTREDAIEIINLFKMEKP